MTPEDMAKLISEMEGMPEAQKAQLKSMGMDPDTSEYYQYLTTFSLPMNNYSFNNAHNTQCL